MKRILNKQQYKLLLIILCLSSSQFVLAQKTFNVTTGDWNVSGNWSPSGIPSSSDSVIIPAGRVVTLTDARSCAAIYFANASNSANGITISASNVLTVTRGVYFTNPAGSAGDQTISIGTGTLSCGSINYELTDNGEVCEVNVSAGTLDVNGDVTFQNGRTRITCTGSAQLFFAGNVTGGGGGNTFTPSTSTATYDGGNQTIKGDTYNKVVLAGSGTKSLEGNCTAADSMIIRSGVTLNNNTSTNLICNSVFYIQGSYIEDNTAGNVRFDGLLHVASTGSFTNFLESFTLRGGIKIEGAFDGGTAGNFTFNTNNQSITSNKLITFPANVAATGITVTNNDSVQIGGTLNGTGGFTNSTNAYLRVNGNITVTTLTASASGNQVLLGGAGQTFNAYNFQQLVFLGSGTKTASGNIGVTTSLTINSGCTFDMSTFALSGASMTTAGSGTLVTSNTSSTPIPTGRTWSFDVTYGANTGSQTVMAGTYNNLALSNTSGTNTASGNLVVNGTLTTTAGGIFSLGTANILSGTLTSVSNSGTINTSVPTATSSTPIPSGKTWGGTVIYAASAGAQTVVAGTYNNLSLSNTSGTNSAGGNLVVNGTLTTTAGGTLSFGTTNILSGTLTSVTNNGTISTSVPTATSATSIPSGKTWGGTMIYAAATGAQTVVAGTYNNLTVANSSGTQATGGNIVVNGTLTTTSGGTFAMGTTNVLSGTLSSIVNNGTITTSVQTTTSSTPLPAGKNWGAAGTVQYAHGSGLQTIVSGTYNNLSMRNNGGANSMGGNITVGGNFSFNTAGSTLAIGSNTATFNGDIINMSATNCFVSNGVSSISIAGSGALTNNLFLAQTSPGTSNRLLNFTYNRASQTITLGDTVEIIGTVTPTAGTLATGDKLKLVSTLLITARVAAGSGTYITGNVIAERHIPSTARRWRFFGSPVSGSTLADLKNETFLTGKNGAANGFDATLSNQASVYTYVEDSITGNLNTGWLAASDITNPITVGKGYRIFIRGDRSDAGRLTGIVASQNAVVLNLVGPLNTGNITLPVTFHSSGTLADDGWNLVANPYASAFDWDAFYTAQNGTGNCTNIDPTIYIYDATTNGYKSYNATSHTGTLTNGIIPICAGFWVKANAASPSLILSETYKTATTPIDLFKTEENKSFSIKLELDSITSDELLIKYMDSSWVNADGYDIQKLAGTVNISAYGADNVSLAASVRPFANTADTIRLNVSGASGSYKLLFSNSNEIAGNGTVLLIDNYLSTVTDITTTNLYTFTIQTGIAATAGANRFYIVVENSLPLPVKLISFDARIGDAKTVQLNWVTSQEINSDKFVIEHSIDGIAFEPIGEVKANGTIAKITNYTFTHNQPYLQNYYRLKQFDKDGSSTYSFVRVVQFKQMETDISIYPIPAVDIINIRHSMAINKLNIYNIMGKLEYTTSDISNEVALDIQTLPQGVYCVELIDMLGNTYKSKFVKKNP